MTKDDLIEALIDILCASRKSTLPQVHEVMDLLSTIGAIRVLCPSELAMVPRKVTQRMREAWGDTDFTEESNQDAQRDLDEFLAAAEVTDDQG